MQGDSMVIYIRRSCRHGKSDEDHDLRYLLACADGIAGMAADLPFAEPAKKHRSKPCRCQNGSNFQQRQGMQREEQEEQQACDQRCVAPALARLAGSGGDAGGLGRWQGLPVPHHRGAAQHASGDEAGSSGFRRHAFDQRCQRRGPQRE